MPGLKFEAVSFATSGIRGLLEKRPDIKRRVERAVWASAIRVQSGAKMRSPVFSGRMKTSITMRALDASKLAVFIGTNVVSKPYVPKQRHGVNAWTGKRFTIRFDFKPRKGSPGGYPYPRRQEFDTTLQHTTGEWGYLRKSLTQEHDHFIDQSRRALVRGLREYA